MKDVEYVTNIFPNELLLDIQKTISLLNYTRASNTVSPDNIDNFNDFINRINIIQDISPNICMMYNNYYDNTQFSCLEGSQIFEAFKCYMPEHFAGYILRRLHVNVTLKHPEYPLEKYTTPHYDSPDTQLSNLKTPEYKTILFYVNSCDGNTVLFNEIGDSSIFEKSSKINLSNMNLNIIHEQTPVENSALIYSSDRLHAQRPNIQSEKRFVINIILEKNEYILP